MENEVFSRRNLVGSKALENSTGVIRSELDYAEKLKTKSARPSDFNSLRVRTRDFNGLTLYSCTLSIIKSGRPKGFDLHMFSVLYLLLTVSRHPSMS